MTATLTVTDIACMSNDEIDSLPIPDTGGSDRGTPPHTDDAAPSPVYRGGEPG